MDKGFGLAMASGTTAHPLMLIGVGPHARTFYLPLLARLQAAGRLRLAVTVDLESSREAVAGFLRGSIPPDEEIYVEPFSAHMPDAVRVRLDAAVARHAPVGVIISTDPLSHRAYAAWALERGLNILLDKPISSRAQAVTDPAAAEGIVTDATMLAAAYERLQARRATCFSVCAHRRYHPGI
ncbi:MAG: Gfo/Idh/MocA family oxidoreductase, partial [Lentisphaerae bacterium]|nr:Gfo/Idh/MocA family oxidoreductase [Lentisphaerota bacterium]